MMRGVEGILDDMRYKIKKIRQKHGYTQLQVANLLNIDRSTYSYYESGKTIPDLKTLVKLAEIFNEPLIELLGSESKPLGFCDSGHPFFDAKLPTVDDVLENWKKNSWFKFDDINDEVVEEKSEETDDVYPKLMSDLSDYEKNLIIRLRMLSAESQKKVSDLIEEKIKNQSS